MVGSVVRPSLLRGSTVRHYAAAAAAQACASATPEIKVLTNKVTVATCDSNSPVAQVSIVFRAGSRNETHDTQGTAHYLRICAGLSTSNASAFAITRNIQQLGGNLVTTQDRETIAYTLQITRNNLVEALKYLESAATKQVFKPWEVSDELPRLKYELATLPDTAVVIDLLHKAAFRNSGLGNSLFCSPHQVGKINSETLQHFVNSWCTAPRCAVVGTGVALSELAALGSNLTIGSGDNANEKAKYSGGEVRNETGAPLTQVALAVEGVSLKSDKDVLACAVLQRASGCGPRVKWGSTVSPLNKQVASAAGSELFGVSTFNASYSDSGLFGVVLCSPPNVAGSLTKAAAKWLKSLNVLESDVARGKNILKTEVLDAADNSTSLLESLQQQALLKGQITSPTALVNAIDKVTAADIKAVADKLAKGNLSLAATGNLKTIPYVDELK
ncbi:cytochrome b-c1 complex subunit 2, mitochondrial [Ceratina calcarata]|uniref:Cytochrome b-c1 complex subunit 2, mitochondrial n=1 Tax=Ceratina calcarata TaxID=156304 RepID=A0AAJ7NA04_9HYME|nr:cytochrome b-c1 complex subunit 2, mitochondrial [Ceratina calcarata]